jgi:hypothetical protein
MRGKPVCRLHGGKGGCPKGEKMAPIARYTAEAKAEEPQVWMLIRGLRHLIDSSAANAVFGVLQAKVPRCAWGGAEGADFRFLSHRARRRG